MTQPITACLIGVDGYGDIHYSDLLRQIAKGTVRIAGATIINQSSVPNKCAHLRSMGCDLFTDYKCMLDALGAQTDLCFIPTGIHLHSSMTIDALEAGANVFVEKPAAATIQDVRAMQQCENATGRFVAVGYQTMYARETFWMKQAILDGKLGDIQYIKSRGLWPRSDSYYLRNNWAGRLRQGKTWILDSPFNNAMAHQLNMGCFLAGTELERSAEIESIQAELYRAREIESPDTACMRIITRTQVPLHFYLTHSSRETVEPEIIVQGEKGYICWTLEKVHMEYGGKSYDMVCEPFLKLRDRLTDQLFRRVHDPSVFICGLDIAATQTLCVNGAHDSSEIHQIDPAMIDHEPAGNSFRSIVNGLDEIFTRAYRDRSLFSELGVSWAREGRVIPMLGYEWFPNNTSPLLYTNVNKSSY